MPETLAGAALDSRTVDFDRDLRSLRVAVSSSSMKFSRFNGL